MSWWGVVCGLPSDIPLETMVDGFSTGPQVFSIGVSYTVGFAILGSTDLFAWKTVQFSEIGDLLWNPHDKESIPGYRFESPKSNWHFDTGRNWVPTLECRTLEMFRQDFFLKMDWTNWFLAPSRFCWTKMRGHPILCGKITGFRRRFSLTDPCYRSMINPSRWLCQNEYIMNDYCSSCSIVVIKWFTHISRSLKTICKSYSSMKYIEIQLKACRCTSSTMRRMARERFLTWSISSTVQDMWISLRRSDGGDKNIPLDVRMWVADRMKYDEVTK